MYIVKYIYTYIYIFVCFVCIYIYIYIYIYNIYIKDQSAQTGTVSFFESSPAQLKSNESFEGLGYLNYY